MASFETKQKSFTVVVETEKLQPDVGDEMVDSLEARFKRLVEEINVTNGQAQLKVVSIEAVE